MARWACGLMFLGINVAFLPMHLTGMLGMPRRVHTYAAGLGWDWLNLVSTVGAFIFASGVVVVLVDLALHLRLGGKVHANVWGASTLEWLPTDIYGQRSIPLIQRRDPLWHKAELAREVEQGQHYLPGSVTGLRETLVTSPLDAKPQYVLIVPGPSWLPLIAGAGTAAFFLLLTVKMVVPAILGGAIGLAAMLRWLWAGERGASLAPVDIGGGITLPTYASGPVSHAWWAMIVLMLVDGTVFASLIFAYSYLGTVVAPVWPPAGATLPAMSWPVCAALAWLASSAVIEFCGRRLANRVMVNVAVAAAIALMFAAFAADLYGQWQTGLRAYQHAYGAAVYTVLAWQGFHVCVLLVMAAYTLARNVCGLLDAKRRVSFDSTRLFWHYMVGQGIAGILLVHGLPRLL